MYKEGHVGAALLVYSPLGLLAMLVAESQLAFTGGVIAAGLAMLPDIDQRVPLIKHRGITHTVWFALVVGLLVGVVGLLSGADGGALVALGAGTFGFLVGTVSICSHILADALTPAGVRPYAPTNDVHYTFDVVRASNPIANYLLLGLGLGVCAIVLRISSAVM